MRRFRFLAAITISICLTIMSVEKSPALTLTGSVDLAFGMEQGPSTGFTLGDVAVFTLRFDDDASLIYDSGSNSFNFNASILEWHVVVNRGGSTIFEILFTDPDIDTLNSIARTSTSDIFYVTLTDAMSSINGHEIIGSGFAFSGPDIFAIAPVDGVDYTFSELFGDGTGLAAASFDLTFSTPNADDDSVLDNWHFIGSSSNVVPEPSGVLLFLTAGIWGLLGMRRR